MDFDNSSKTTVSSSSQALTKPVKHHHRTKPAALHTWHDMGQSLLLPYPAFHWSLISPPQQTKCCTVYSEDHNNHIIYSQRWEVSPPGGRGVREEKAILTIGPLTSLGIVSSWELVGVVASSPIQGTEGKCYASLQEGQDTTNDILKKETYRKKGRKKKRGANKNRELLVKQKRKQQMQNSEGCANFKWVLF